MTAWYGILKTKMSDNEFLGCNCFKIQSYDVNTKKNAKIVLHLSSGYR